MNVILYWGPVLQNAASAPELECSVLLCQPISPELCHSQCQSTNFDITLGHCCCWQAASIETGEKKHISQQNNKASNIRVLSEWTSSPPGQNIWLLCCSIKKKRKIDFFLIFLLKTSDKFLFSLQKRVFCLPQSQSQMQFVAFVRLWLYGKKVFPNIYLNSSFIYLQLKHIVEILKAPRQLELQNVLSPVNINLGRTLQPGRPLIKRSPDERIDQCRFTWYKNN